MDGRADVVSRVGWGGHVVWVGVWLGGLFWVVVGGGGGGAQARYRWWEVPSAAPALRHCWSDNVLLAPFRCVSLPRCPQ